jgi:signal transduction histidine kinase
METGIMELSKREMPVFDTIVTAVNRIYPHAEEKKIEISLTAEDELKELLVPHDNKWLSEAIINVLENAVKYSPPQTEITLRMLRREAFLRIEIEDKGIGIPSNERNKVFRRFYRGESYIVREQSGSGVGLYLAREILERHQGSIIVTTPADRTGSLFVLQIPYGKPS